MNLSSISLPLSKSVSSTLLFIILFFSCHQETGKSSKRPTRVKQQHFFIQTSPSPDQVFSFTDSVRFRLSSKNQKITADSVLLFSDGLPTIRKYETPMDFSIHNLFHKTGRHNFRLKVFYNDSLSQVLTTRIFVLSELEPLNLKYKVIRKLPHDINDYTQGYFYHDGILYEGTGEKGRSKLKKINPLTGETILERKLKDEFFGEGIALFNDQIYQLTYHSGVGFVYDMNTFEQVREFNLQTSEGWGLTSDGKHLIVSEGSSILYFFDPAYFSQVKILDVCDNKKLVTQLNELEYVNQSIWANVYGETRILKIDASSGKVLARLDLDALFPKDIPRDMRHVLNGIAYNPDTDTWFVTGKLWPLLYEIKIFD